MLQLAKVVQVSKIKFNPAQIDDTLRIQIPGVDFMDRSRYNNNRF